MPTFGMETEKDINVDLFFEKANKKLQEGTMIGGFNFSFYKGIIKKLPSYSKTRSGYIIDMTSQVFKFYNIFLVLFFGHRLFEPLLAFNKWDIILLGFYFLFGWFFTRYWIFFVSMIGLRKAGYKGKLKILSDTFTMQKMVSLL